MVNASDEVAKRIRYCKECGKRLPFMYRKRKCWLCIAKKKEENRYIKR